MEGCINLKILGLDYDVEEKQDHHESSGEMGLADSKASKIIIIGKQKEDCKQSTILHEVIHIVSDKNGLNLKEGQVLCLESALFAFLKDNKEFIEEVIK